MTLKGIKRSKKVHFYMQNLLTLLKPWHTFLWANFVHVCYPVLKIFYLFSDINLVSTRNSRNNRNIFHQNISLVRNWMLAGDQYLHIIYKIKYMVLRLVQRILYITIYTVILFQHLRVKKMANSCKYYFCLFYFKPEFTFNKRKIVCWFRIVTSQSI